MKLREHIAPSRTPSLPSPAAGARTAPPLWLVRTIRTQISVLRLVSVYLVGLTLASGSVTRTWTTSVQTPAHLLPAPITTFMSNRRSTSTSPATGALAATTSTGRIPAHLLYSVFTIISSEFVPPLPSSSCSPACSLLPLPSQPVLFWPNPRLRSHQLNLSGPPIQF